ncbi:Ataxin-10 [Sergentomyia squamirostris]
MFTSDSVKEAIEAGDISPIVNYIKEDIENHASSKHSRTEDECDFSKTLPTVLEIFFVSSRLWCSAEDSSVLRSSGKLLQTCIRFLKISCAHSKLLQEEIVQKNGVLEALRDIVENTKPSEDCQLLKEWCWQLLVNTIVDNIKSLKLMWPHMGEYILQKIRDDYENALTTTAVLYNAFKLSLDHNVEEIPTLNIFTHIIEILEKNIETSDSTKMEYIHLLLEYFITECGKFREIYSQISGHDRIWTIYYITDHVKDGNESRLSVDVLKCLPGEFNKKSQCILNSKNPEYESNDPKEVMALLRCFVAITGSEKYEGVYKQEASLFINICGVLVAICSLSAKGDSTFAPLGKLEDFTPTSEGAKDAEKEIFYELKSLLVRLIANLSHKNRKNQDLARELKALLTICGCTTMDAKNPMMKEWAIVALKNLLEGNADNQNVIRSLVNTGPAANSALTELMMENGTVRINRNQE